jgi:predicted membrane protein
MSDDYPLRTTTSQRTTSRKPRRLVSVFGDITRGGAWRLSAKTSAIAIFGDVDLDVRQATFSPEGSRISAIAPFGNIDIAVPTGAAVDVGGFTFFGSKKVDVDGAASDASETLIAIRGFSVFGSLKVRSS